MSQEEHTREAMRKFSVGDGLTDQELDLMLDFFTNAKLTLHELLHIDASYGFAYLI